LRGELHLSVKEKERDSEEMPRHIIPSLFPAEAYPSIPENSHDRDYP
jgi:hypothetical protein